MSDLSPFAITPASTAVSPAQLVCAPTVREWPGLSIPELADGPRSRHQLFQHANLSLQRHLATPLGQFCEDARPEAGGTPEPVPLVDRLPLAVFPGHCPP